ncbi:MAG TPA: SEC-C metal-binding domain-containing protein, partial [Acidimicrobiales bacterium]|nr:SEC-C metal-binding domain-containing protein [Acidimicrobiales bacterium]
LPPAGELLERCGYEVRDDFAAPHGTDWDAFGRIQAAARAGRAHGLDVGDTHALAAICEFYRLFAMGRLDAHEPGDAELWAEVAGVVTDRDAGPAFLDVVLGEGGLAALEAAAVVESFLAVAERHAGRRWGAGLAWARSLVARRAGDHDRAEAALRAVLASDPNHEEGLWHAAWYASDRGDARRAMALLARLAEEGDDEAEERMGSLRRFAIPPTPLAGRNDPCPCGSGRKHKHCCLGLPRHPPLPDRVGWVWEKLDWFLRAGGFEDDVEEVLHMLGSEPMDELLAVSLVLFQDGAVDEFLLQRGPLLPDDERNLVTQWALRERSVHEVVEVRRGEGFTLRDVRTGDVEEVRERRGSTQVVPGDLICAHVVPDGHTNQLVGGLIVVPLWLRDPLMSVLDAEPTALELAALIARSAAPPELFNTEGEAMVLCETRYRVPDPSALAGLDRVLDADGEGTWTESVEVDGKTWLRGSVTLSGDELVVASNSRERSRRLRATVEAAVPGLRVVSEEETPAAEVMARRDRG